MKTLRPVEHGLHVIASSPIKDVVTEGISLSKKWNRVVSFQTNEVNVVVLPDSNPKLILRDLKRALNNYISKIIIGPYPSPSLTKKERASDARIEKQNELSRRRLTGGKSLT